jgi:hypothetical protein
VVSDFIEQGLVEVVLSDVAEKIKGAVAGRRMGSVA